MKTTGVVIAAVLALGLLSACSSDPDTASTPAPAPTITSDVAVDSTPGFLSTAAAATDALPAGVDAGSVDPASIRYQGLWNGKNVYLGVEDKTKVVFITGLAGDSSSWKLDEGEGNAPLTIKDDKSSLTYVPQGADSVPDGYYPFSAWVVLK